MDRNLNTLLILRLLATFAVVIGHAASFFGAFDFTQWPHSPYLQSMAVTIFFAVSGFTIAWVIDTRQSVGFLRFAYDRYMRLAIPLLPVLSLFWIVEALLYRAEHPYPGSLSVNVFLGNLALLQNMAGFDIPPFGTNRALWTISVEYWIYIAYGGVLLGLRHRSIGALALALLAVALLVPYVSGGRGDGLPMVWLAGAGLYHLLKNVDTIPNSGLLIVLPALALNAYLLGSQSFWPSGGEFSPLYNIQLFALFALLMLAGMTIQFPRWIMRGAVKGGACAYTIYLSHYPIQEALWKFDVLGSGTKAALVATGISIAAGWALSLPFEQRYKGIRDKIARLLSELAKLWDR